MYTLIERFMNKLTKEQVDDFARKNNVELSAEELDFTFLFVKKNWQAILSNPDALNLERYKEKFSEENYKKIEELIKFYVLKYKNYL